MATYLDIVEKITPLSMVFKNNTPMAYEVVPAVRKTIAWLETLSRESANELSQESSLNIPKLSTDQIILCDIELTEKDLYDSMKSMENDKSPGNDGLTKEFYVTFWDDIKATFISSLKQAKERKELSISQRQAIIKLIEKKDRDKRYIKNWRPISLLNVDIKILSKALAKRLKEVLPCLISAQQTAYVKNRNIGESGRLISDIIEIANTRKMEGFLVTMDVEKAFDSLDHTFLISVLKRFGFGQNFVS